VVKEPREDAGREIGERIRRVRERIAGAAERSGRDPSEVRLIGVTKTVPVEGMLPALPLLDGIGENRVQEAEAKRLARAWPETPPWRMIGRLQRNKARRALALFASIDSVDSLPLAETLDRILSEGDPREGAPFPILLEVNVSGEPTRGGVAPEGLEPLLVGIRSGCPRLAPEGLMAVAPLEGGEPAARRAFEGLRRLRDGLAPRVGLPLRELSMGMSGDFEAAVTEGSTLVRIGSALFGARG